MKMRLTSLLMVLFMASFSIACKNSKSKSTAQNTVQKTENLLYTASWKAVTDKLGSAFKPEKIAVVDSLMEVNFTLKQQKETEIVFIELVCGLGHNLSKHSGLKINYKCETPLVVKLSQSDFGKDGDKSYAHYQFIVPASEKITTTELSFADFTQPIWTPEASKGKAMKLENIDAIYLVPNIDAATGGKSLLGVKALYLKTN